MSFVERNESQLKWNWTSRPIKPKINRNFNSAKMHVWSKLGHPNFKQWCVIVWKGSKWGSDYFQVKFDLESQGQSLSKAIGILTKVFCTSTLVILVWTDYKLSCGQAGAWHAGAYTQTQATTIFKTLRTRQDGRHFADDIFRRIFLNENIEISIEISLKVVPNGPINNIPALVQVMAWRRPGDKPFTEPMVVISLTHICVTRP